MEIDLSGIEDFMLILQEKNQKAIEEYSRNQECEDMIANKMNFKEYNHHFNGSK